MRERGGERRWSGQWSDHIEGSGFGGSGTRGNHGAEGVPRPPLREPKARLGDEREKALFALLHAMRGSSSALLAASRTAVVLGVVCVPVYMGANAVGAWLFDPKAERLFRRVAYIVIGVSAILGLPLWS